MTPRNAHRHIRQNYGSVRDQGTQSKLAAQLSVVLDTSVLLTYWSFTQASPANKQKKHVSLLMAYLHVLQHQHGLAAPQTRPVELHDIAVIADRLQDVYLLHAKQNLQSYIHYSNTNQTGLQCRRSCVCTLRQQHGLRFLPVQRIQAAAWSSESMQLFLVTINTLKTDC